MMNETQTRIDHELPKKGLGDMADPLESRPKAKSSLRLKYEAEAQVLKSRLGDLEAIRQKLGFSQRKICQLLLVDPSAWTRWTRRGDGEGAPPHVYRMLQWYMALNEKYPALDAAFWLSTVSRDSHETEREKAQQLDQKLKHDFQNLSTDLGATKESLLKQLHATQDEIRNLRVKTHELRTRSRIVIALLVLIFSALVTAGVLSYFALRR